MKVTRYLDMCAVVGLLLALGWFNPGNAGATQWCDPRDNWTCFRNWCCEQGGCPDQPTSSCKPGGSGCSHPCGGSASGSTYAPAYDPAAAEAARRAAELKAIEDAKMKEFKRKEKINKVKRDRVEDENDRRESKAKEEFEKRQTALTKRLKPAVEAIYSEEKAAELALENQADVTPEVKKAWTQLHCSHSITIEMMGVVRVGDVQGAKYMNDQAEAAFGEGELGVRCPPASAIPAPYGMDVLRSEGPVARMQRDLRAQAFNRALEIEKIRKEREHLWEKLRKDLGSEELEDATKHLIAVHVKELRKEKEEGKKPEAKPEPAEPAPIPEEKTEEKTEESAEEKAKEEAEQKKKKSRQAMIKALAALQFAEEEAQKEVDSLSEASQNAFENPVKD